MGLYAASGLLLSGVLALTTLVASPAVLAGAGQRVASQPASTVQPSASASPVTTQWPTSQTSPVRLAWAGCARDPDLVTRPTPAPSATPAPTPAPTPTPKATPKPAVKPAARTATAAPVLSGHDRFWFPALGIADAVHTFDCASSSAIPAGIWRFGCHGGRNIYLMSHAWSDFGSLRTAYHAGRLNAGMIAYYAGPDGHVLRYQVAWVRHVDVSYFNATYYQWALEDVDALTLQTCDGANNEYRIVVRLTRA